MRPRSVTGVWQGLYSYPDGTPSIAFVATLIEAGTALTGTTHETCALPGHPAATLFAAVAASRRESVVSFTKTYDPGIPDYDAPVLYEGRLNAEATEIEGRWVIVRTIAGRFLMIRAPGADEAIMRKVAQPVS